VYGLYRMFMTVLAFVNSSIQYEYTKTEQFLWFAINPASAQHFSHQGYAIVHYLSSSTEHSNLERDRKKLCVLLQFQTRRWIDLANLMFGTRCAKFKPEQKNEDAQDKQQISCFLEKVQKCFLRRSGVGMHLQKKRTILTCYVYHYSFV